MSSTIARLVPAALARPLSGCAAIVLACAVAGCGGGGSSTGGTGSGTGTGTGTGSGSGSGNAAPIYVVGASATLPAGATRVATMMEVPWARLAPGSRVIVSSGNYDGVTTITSHGTQASPITVAAADAAHPPVLGNSVDLQGAAWVQVSGLVVQSPDFAGFVIRQASHHVTVADSAVHGAPIGISITDGAGIGNRLLRNTVTDSATQGISVEVNADPAERSLIQRNEVLRSGQHGIELRASHYQVESNIVSASGQASGGTSGIHVFSGGPLEDSGDDNLIRYNRSYANVDGVAVDGNGIELDQWCDANLVAYNLAWGNDGAGVIVFDGKDNAIVGNTTYGNGLDSGHTHVALGEIILNATSAGAVTGNRVWNNLLASTHDGVPALYVDSRALAGANAIGANLYANSATGGALVRWGDGTLLRTAAAIDAATGAAGSAVDAPSFADASQPLRDGLRLTHQPSHAGVPPDGDVDILGNAPQAGWTFFGAYFTAP